MTERQKPLTIEEIGSILLHYEDKAASAFVEGLEVQDLRRLCAMALRSLDQRTFNDGLEKIDLKAEAGLCQFSAVGKQEFLKDIRKLVTELRALKDPT